MNTGVCTNWSSLDARERSADIDARMRWSVIFFVLSAGAWLLLGTLLGVVGSISLHDPDYFVNLEILTFGRVDPAYYSVFTFGWLNNAIFAVCIWVMARLCQPRKCMSWVLVVAGVFWNLSLSVGAYGILTGDLRSTPWMELPHYAMPPLFASYACIALWVLMAYWYRTTKETYASQWYILAAFLWFPAIFIVAQSLVFIDPMRGVLRAIVAGWYKGSLFGLWYIPLGLGVVYYFFPKVLGRPLYSYYLSAAGFLGFALFVGWSGVSDLTGGPVPVWVSTVGIVASIMLLTPTVLIAVNFHMTSRAELTRIWESPTLRFCFVGTLFFVSYILCNAINALRSINEITHFTQVTVGLNHHLLYGFVAMSLFGGVYYCLPRILGKEWPFRLLIFWHFWCAAGGTLVMVLSLYIGGWVQGMALNGSTLAFKDVIELTLPALLSRSTASIMLGVGHIAFVMHIICMLFTPKKAEEKAAGPTLFNSGGKI